MRWYTVYKTNVRPLVCLQANSEDQAIRKAIKLMKIRPEDAFMHAKLINYTRFSY